MRRANSQHPRQKPRKASRLAATMIAPTRARASTGASKANHATVAATDSVARSPGQSAWADRGSAVARRGAHG